ncbi:hypothetical protein [Streptomyces sp. NPDC097619]|uniref:hypothetical protein n=1 Tax=Streptomyces sp. NPDC097619 TaxID=3157228 RepID=UPI003318F53B
MTPTTHTQHSARLRRTLRREVPGTVGLLTDPRDFAAMTGYRSFPFRDEDWPSYLGHLDGLLKSLRGQGLHTTVTLFDPDDYAAWCTETGADPDTPAARTRFTAHLAATGTALPYTGEPLDTLLPRLVDAAVRQATWEYATLLLAGLGPCAECGADIGADALDRAGLLLDGLLTGAGPGHHHLVCSVPAEREQLVAPHHTGGGARSRLEFLSVLAAGIALDRPGGVVLRTSGEGGPDRVHGWRLTDGALTPLTAAEVFDAYCTDADSGDLLPPEPGVTYCAGFPVADPGPRHGHHR